MSEVRLGRLCLNSEKKHYFVTIYIFQRRNVYQERLAKRFKAGCIFLVQKIPCLEGTSGS